MITIFKKCIPLLLLVTSSGISMGQIANTRWKGEINIPDPTTVLFDFKMESVTIYYAGDKPMDIPDENGNTKSVSAKDSMIIESMTFSLKHDTVAFQKLSGHSPCDQQAVGYFTLVKGNNSIQLVLLKDDCVERGAAFDKKTLMKAD
ncbi:MAG TPA: hypothetical protein VKR32_02255 [Puia sp.]|nr:hypothetical protein [Puia sp.]